MPKSENVTIVNNAGVELQARIDFAGRRHRGWAIFAHCFTCSKDSLAAARVSQELAMEGIATMRIDFTGLGQSGGSFEDTSFTSNLDDITAAANWLAENYDAPQLLVGHSLGGAAVLAVASKIPSIKGVTVIGAPADPTHVGHLFADALPTIEADGVATISLGGRPITIGKTFVEDLQNHDGAKNAKELNADLLILHSPVDTIVGIENAASIYAAAKHPKSFVSLDKADHLLSARHDSAFAARVISAWASRCLGDANEVGADTDDGVALVASSGDGIFAHDVRVGPHSLRADEPTSMEGGLDTGPAPYDFLKVGLGACTAITIRMVATRKGWPLEQCRVNVRHRREGEGEQARDIFTRDIELDGALDNEQRSFLLNIANKCPVHKTLERSSETETNLSE